MSEIGEFLTSRIGKEYFAMNEEEYDKNMIPKLAQNNPKRIVIGIIRETIGPFINRSTEPDETITLQITNGKNTREVIEVPARKFKSKEKLLGIRLCKLYNVIDKTYRYNSLDDKIQLNNPVSAIFGDTIVSGGSENAGKGMFPSRVLYSSSYSIRDKSLLTERLTHNALSENGTMWDEKGGKNRQSLFETEYVIPEVYFPSFLTLIDPTPETLYFVLQTLKSNSYGAQTSITGSNFKNNSVFILGCYNEPGMSSYTISKDWDMKEEITKENITKCMIEKTNSLISPDDKLIEGKNLSEIENFLNNVPYELSLKAFKTLADDVNNLFQFANFGGNKKGKKGENLDKKNMEE